MSPRRARRAGPAPLSVMTVVGTRPELIKMSRVIAAFDRHTRHTLVHTGQNFDDGLNGVFFRQLEIRKPDHFLNVADRTAAQTIANVIARTDDLLAKVRPDAFVVYGDTNSCLSAIAAKRRRIPVFHLEAGNRCFDDRVPEEVNRRIIDHLSDINMPLTEHARTYLLREGLRPETVLKIGSTMREVLEYYRAGIEASDALQRLKLEPRRYFVVSAHREENVDDPARLSALVSALSDLARRYRRRIIVSTHPRTRKRLTALFRSSGRAGASALEFLPPFGFFEWIKLQTEAFCVVSDSGTLSEESALLGFPAVMIREAHERPEGMEAGATIMAGLSAARIEQAVEVATSRPGGVEVRVADYADADVSGKVLRIVLSYVDYVRRT
ncbi:MAG TPA: UDP-N-acetylglucosamine 2-epimerase (non-hydrolyzing), partial [Vicinamibacterales bacterium]|nr:UDP-N-acetylglucosamine 2-epimerase (non-hydrolyzing) [Vicinamibacterales bacterium]